ncbi:hypothetical protein GCM10027280_03950 [Micromonospora polyrhachis]|uniref:7-cyano-7-deazaguanine synthase (Queuosine biosynthesis) n=1 Tax=Micromonospora polyrhachis TaxID=1282883 RepID=A0A7W7WMY8_9ACTN|nr:DUF6395 domain-containing protein [Micromonospora polyrhachis]MBB4957305.1 hypothetical protein [Micromonospora polyrhachis]
MRTAWEIDGTTWRLRLRLDPEDTLTATGQDGRAIELLTDRCRIELPEPAGGVHPDLRALAAWLILQPWAGRRVSFDQPVSSYFAEAIQAGWGVVAGPVDPGLAPRAAGPVAGLSYSGGYDSLAVSLMLPPETPHLFFRRVPHPRVPNRATHVKFDVAQRLVEEAGGRGRRVAVVRSDLEYLTLPFPMLPTWPAFAIGLTLLADRLDLGAIAFGTVLESRFLHNGRRFSRDGVSAWAQPFAAAGLPMLRPAAGMTEVLTLGLAAGSDLGDLARSCLLGTNQSPCLACVKCLRKELILAALRRGPLPAELLRRIPATHRVARELLDGGPPFYFQDMLEYGLARARVDGTFLAALRDRLSPTIAGTAWAEHYYPPTLDLEVPPPWRPTIARFVADRIGLMTADEVTTVQTWDAASRPALANVLR